jgi:hypothetical protein
MDGMFIIFYVLSMVLMVILGFFTFVIFKGVGFRNLFAIFKTKIRRRKGWGLIRMLHLTGYPQYIPVIFDSEQLVPFPKNKEEKYILKRYCIYENEYGIPTIDYRKGEADPIDYRAGVQTVTSPKVLGNLQARAIKAENSIDPGMEWLKNNWKTIGIGVLIFVGIAAFGFINLLETNSAMAQQLALVAKDISRNTIINATTLGK